ncbi:phenylalanine--tRNA ligase subunit beta [Virgibacillus pantothenticus]|uniref:phenylalanine--tRNA ligase subunit beta n=1 Tax=Virgibacillus TaxID=84406 RepID=UPI00090C9B03|nr:MULTISPECIES: phenylalanine--tRNA ligase subunit beta [Virgibacillus]API90791.1 phenylalanine--tRNA ligase subunit beta [Virgibacillus sp. 6R]MBS7426780.1 phenylalanine--tRNA ligase subunit beta [Virgibacillus sp. 19R1-5]MBU8566107.1 phenylalanine--tRNA ligase subunit beta [Virgibacillus pantothenticus]MBU8600597.1 phenylalanine--tRNA ligase subunit beta [Virgibacillus pantothenticus]MBU8634427.1 phenylalanine--tRNA ligase subunit beta [Virgibacillus pantothenticus]
MLVSLNWLKNYVDITDVSPEELANKITKSGIEVDGIEYVAEKSENVVIGYVVSCEKHPNADKLHLCQVDVGDETLQIICGAPNVAQGQKVAVAKPGAVLPGNFKIKRVKLRGVESNGMICSLQELGIEEKYVPKDVADGIYVFPTDVTVGESVEPLLNLNDAVLEFDLTPNRADCLSMLGVAYEVGAILNREVRLPNPEPTMATGAANDYIAVQVEAPNANPYYGAFVIRNVTIQPSPLWMRNYLIAAGIRPINNVVDITNYVLLEYGQPLHAFDYDKLQSDKIVVRHAKEKETIITLDEQERVLSKDHLVITNGKEPIALAGVMGGLSTEVTDTTKNILLEAAYFDPAIVMNAVKATGLRSESSTRFTKGVDPNRVKEAGLRACELLEKYANATVAKGVVAFDELNRGQKQVEINIDEINKRLGTSLVTSDVEDALKRLQFEFEPKGNEYLVHIPTRRGDITIFEDMLEEVARIYGYDKLPYTLPVGAGQAGGLTERQLLLRKIKHLMEASGLLESRTYTLISEAAANTLISPELAEANYVPIELALPMSADHKFLRISLLPEILRVLAHNRARNQFDLGYYEIGKTFLTTEKTLTKQPEERLRLAGAITGNWIHHPWQQESKQVDFYVVKGILEKLFTFLGCSVAFQPLKHQDMHPGRTASLQLEGRTIGFVGQLHPHLQNQLDLKETYVFDVNMEELLSAYNEEPSYQEIPKYPSIDRDIAFVLDSSVLAAEVKQVIMDVGAPLVKHVSVFDVYEGEHLKAGKKSVAFHLVYQHPEKTLTDDEVQASYEQIITAVKDKFAAYIRS